MFRATDVISKKDPQVRSLICGSLLGLPILLLYVIPTRINRKE